MYIYNIYIIYIYYKYIIYIYICTYIYKILSNNYIYVEISDGNKQHICYDRSFSELFIIFISVLILTII